MLKSNAGFYNHFPVSYTHLLLARAEQLLAQAPNLRGRLFTQIAPEDWDLNGFYTKAGFKMDDSEDLYHFGLPGWPARAPVNCNYASVPLKTPQDVQAFLPVSYTHLWWR